MYVILPSNTPAAGFPDNKSSSFTVPFKLDTPSLEKWRVGLVHIQVPLTFFNIESDETIVIEHRDGSVVVMRVDEGAYIRPEKLVEMLLRRGGEDFFKLEWRSGFVISIDPTVTRMRFSPRLGRLLGFTEWLEGGLTIKSSVRRYDPWINHKVLLVHCSLVQPAQFNDRYYPILQTLSLQHLDFGETFYDYFTPVEYIEVQGENHSSVTLSITDLEGSPIRFRSGNVVLGLTLQHDPRGRRDSNHR